jgi:uncharacterized protein YaaW (UPF0174 family)
MSIRININNNYCVLLLLSYLSLFHLVFSYDDVHPFFVALQRNDFLAALKSCNLRDIPAEDIPGINKDDLLANILRYSSKNAHALPLVSCLVKEKFIDVSTLSDNGGDLLLAAVGRKHEGLLDLLLSEKTLNLFKIDPLGSNVALAAISTRSMTMELSQKLLSVSPNNLVKKETISFFQTVPLLWARCSNYSPQDTATLNTSIQSLLGEVDVVPGEPLSTYIIGVTKSDKVFAKDLENVANSMATCLMTKLFKHAKESVAKTSKLLHFYLSHKDRLNRTALHHATISNNLVLIKSLLHEMKSLSPLNITNYITQKDSMGMSSIDLACIYRNHKIGTILGGTLQVPSYKEFCSQRASRAMMIAKNYTISNIDVSKTLVNQDAADGILTSENLVDDGGWISVTPSGIALDALNVIQSYHAQNGTKKCDPFVKIIDSSLITEEQLKNLFYTSFYLENRPVVIRNYSSMTTLKKRWTRNTLRSKKETSQLTFDVSAVPYEKQFGGSSKQITLGEYINEISSAQSLTRTGQPFYIFDSPIKWTPTPPISKNGKAVFDESTKALFGEFDLILPFLKKNISLANGESPFVSLFPYPKPQFYLGPPGSGAQMHFHKDAINYLAFGEKEWILFAPERTHYSTVPISDWVALHLPRYLNSTKFQPYLCTQQAGDLMYVPHGWGHAVLNLRTSIGVAIEFNTVAWPF